MVWRLDVSIWANCWKDSTGTMPWLYLDIGTDTTEKRLKSILEMTTSINVNMWSKYQMFIQE